MTDSVKENFANLMVEFDWKCKQFQFNQDRNCEYLYTDYRTCDSYRVYKYERCSNLDVDYHKVFSHWADHYYLDEAPITKSWVDTFRDYDKVWGDWDEYYERFSFSSDDTSNS